MRDFVGGRSGAFSFYLDIAIILSCSATRKLRSFVSFQRRDDTFIDCITKGLVQYLMDAVEQRNRDSIFKLIMVKFLNHG